MFHDPFRSAEQQYFYTKTGTIEGLYLDSMDNYFIEFLSFPGVQSWWSASKHSFEINFQKHIEQVMDRAKAKTFSSTFSKPDGETA